MRTFDLFVNGRWVKPEKEAWIDNVNPATGQVFCRVAAAGEKEVEEAIQGAYEAQKSWKKTLAKEREKILLRAADYMEENAEKFLPDLIDESGSSYTKMSAEIGSCVDLIRTAAGECSRLGGGVVQDEYKNYLSYYVRNPLGVVAGISPFNYPLFLAIDKVAFALAVGNTFILKPASYTPISGLVIAECFEHAGLPEGVLSVLPGSGKTVGDALVMDERVKMVALTGSSEVGRNLARKAAGMFKKYSLELGGKNPMLVLKDYDPEKAADLASFGGFFHQGQICMATSRIVVEAPVYESFCKALADRAGTVPMGDPHKPETIVGPLINEKQCLFLDELVEDAVSKGARLLAGGKHEGAYYAPTVLADVKQEMRVFYEECFGPVISVVRAGSPEEGIKLCNDNEFGLSSSILTNDITLALSLTEDMEAGMVHINESTVVGSTRAPFGGVKSSGVGRENGPFSVEEYTEVKWITVQY
jgi:acyl-CoA reductase-like NAD-dependent aldehyde dehydrogenase